MAKHHNWVFYTPTNLTLLTLNGALELSSYFCISPFLRLRLLQEKSNKTPAYVNGLLLTVFWGMPAGGCRRVSGPFCFYFFLPLVGSFHINKIKNEYFTPNICAMYIRFKYVCAKHFIIEPQVWYLHIVCSRLLSLKFLVW